MLDTFLEALTGRRLGGALLVLAGIVVGAIVLWPSGDDDGSAASGRPAKIQPVRIVSVPQLGFTFAYPTTWSRTVSGRVIRLEAPRESAFMTFASPVSGRHTDQVLADAKDALRASYAPATIVRDGPAKLGERKVTSFELEGVDHGAGIRALVLVGSSAERTYVVTLVTPTRPSAKTLAQAQQVLATVRLAKPEVASKG
jgi:hypothetical protein